jgi:hypothetical protein
MFTVISRLIADYADIPAGQRSLFEYQIERRMKALRPIISNASGMRVRILDDFLYITIGFFGLAGNLPTQSLCLLFLAAHQLADFFLHLTCDVLCRAFDLILVHFNLLVPN